MSEIDKEFVETLQRSKAQLQKMGVTGFLQPAVRETISGILLSGSHRKVVDPNWPEKTVTIEDELIREVLSVHYNVHRRIPQQENEAKILRIAELVEEKGVPTRKVCQKLYELLPYTPRYIRLCLPKRFKQDYVNSEIFPNVPSTIGRVEASKRLSKFLKSKTPGKGDETIQMMSNPELPFTDCKCAVCDHFKECRGIL